MNKLYDDLEKCLQAIEQGADIDSALAQYPDFKVELRPILEASIQARAMAASDPSPEVMRRGRANLLQRAAEMREARAPAPRRMIPGFQRLAISFVLAAVFLLSGNGLVRASSTALPGENLYPVKRTWEDMRLLFVFDEESRETLETEFENERLHEVSELLNEGRDETIQFAGVWLEVNGQYYASGIRVVILDSTQLPAEALQNGAAVIVTGHTNAAGFVEADTIQLLPVGTHVPVGQPVEVEKEAEESATPKSGSSGEDQNDNSNSNSNDDNGNSNSNDENSNDNSNDNGNDNGNDNSNDNGDDSNNDNSNNDENSNDDNSGHGGGDDNSGGGEDESGGGGGGED